MACGSSSRCSRRISACRQRDVRCLVVREGLKRKKPGDRTSRGHSGLEGLSRRYTHRGAALQTVALTAQERVYHRGAQPNLPAAGPQVRAEFEPHNKRADRLAGSRLSRVPREKPAMPEGIPSEDCCDPGDTTITQVYTGWMLGRALALTVSRAGGRAGGRQLDVRGLVAREAAERREAASAQLLV